MKESYMELCLHVDGGENLYLRVPTVWDDIKKQWIGFVKLPKSKKIVLGNGKTSFELQNSFNASAEKIFHGDKEIADELFSMFMPAFYWEE